MNENEVLKKQDAPDESLSGEIEAIKETESLSGKIEAIKESAEEAAENIADKTIEDLEAENEKLRKQLEIMKEKTVKERIYDHVHVSVRTMDIFIGVMVALFVIVVILGILNK